MRTIGEMLSDRKVTRFDLQLMAMRDLTDVHLHPELPDITEKAVRGPGYTPSESVYKPHTGQDKDKQVVEHIVRHSSLSRQEWDLFQQTVRKVQFQENKLNEITKRRKPESKYGYKGIR